MQSNDATPKRKRTELTENATENPLMLGGLPKVAGDELHKLQQLCTELLQQRGLRFPGSQPVSFERWHLSCRCADQATVLRSSCTPPSAQSGPQNCMVSLRMPYLIYLIWRH